MRFACRLSPHLFDLIERLSGWPISIAEVNRLVGAEAECLGITRPSYERVRELVHEARWLKEEHPSVGRTVLDVATRTRSHAAYVELAARGPRPRLRDRPRK
ncbi:MAG: hypothetical protein ACRDL7_03475 [Gaiellaceae bacterium]